MSHVERFKVVLLGEGRVGKTSILLRYTKGEYSDRQVYLNVRKSFLDTNLFYLFYTIPGLDITSKLFR